MWNGEACDVCLGNHTINNTENNVVYYVNCPKNIEIM